MPGKVEAMGKKGQPVKGAKGMKALNKLGKAAKKALLNMPRKERELVVAGLSKGNTSNWSAKKLREGLVPKGKKKAEADRLAPVNHQTARMYFTKPGQVRARARARAPALPARTRPSPRNG